ncbi:MAG TPA: zf-HC2 domain-containing protein [Anaerolineales bacterium]|nr:zf-HC2 domain-containing protein [Anaerolineales bacterium]
MNGISHKQAIQLIYRRLDGLLNEGQLSSLEEHLRSCDSCRAYATHVDGLSARLQNEFHRRWDAQAGPSQTVMKQVTAKAKKIPVANRISSGSKLLAGALALIILAVSINFVVSRLQSAFPVANATESGNHTLRPEDRLLAFTSDQNGNFDIYTMHADGTSLTNLTNHPAHDTNPVWSPDGKHLAFESDRDGLRQIYLMDADGANLIRLTKEEADHSLPEIYDGRYNPWSPDGSRLVFVQEDPGGETAALYSVEVNGENEIKLADGKNVFSGISWSPDGSQVAFVLNGSPTPRETYVPDIYIINSDGNNLRELKSFLPEGETLAFTPYYWSSSGQSIVFTSYTVTGGPLRQTLYEFDVITSTFSNRTDIRPDVMDWRDGIALRIEVNQYGTPYVWERSDGTTHTFEESGTWGESCSADLTRSPQNNFAIGGYCPTTKFNLYWTNEDGSTIKHLLTVPIHLSVGGVGDITWSPDEQYLAFNLTTDEKTEMYVVKVEEALANPATEPLRFPVSDDKKHHIPSWQPVPNQEIAEEVPTPKPTQTVVLEELPPIGTGVGNGEWIAFIGGQVVPDPAEPSVVTVNRDVYKVHRNGSGLTNLTGFPAHYYGLQWSPDGQHLLFLREDPVTNKVDMMRHYAGVASGFGEVTRPFSDPDHYGYSWSPNSDKIVFADASNGNYDIYTVYADGRNDPKLRQLTDDPAQDVGFAWSPDGSQLAFQRLDGDKLSIYIMNEDGSDPREVAHGVGQVKLEWSHDGTSIYASSVENNWLSCEGCVAKPAIYRIQLDDSSVHQIYYEKDGDQVAGWYLYDTPQDMLYFMRINRPNFVELWGTWFRADGNSVTEIGELDPQQTCKTTTGSILNESISPNPRFSIISNFCAGGFDLYLADREAAPDKRFIHLLQLPLDTEGQGGDFTTLPIGWSPDGRWLIYDNGRETVYLLDIERAIHDSEAALTPLIEPILYTGADGQVYQSSETISVFDLVWQPVP